MTGQFIDSVAEPELLVTGVSRAQNSVDVTATTSAITVDEINTHNLQLLEAFDLSLCLIFNFKACDVINAERMHCPIPETILTSLPNRRRRQADDEEALVELYIGLHLDGVPTYRFA